MDEAEQTAAGSLDSEICECRRHTCNLSNARVVQTFEVLDETESRTCYKKFLIACIIILSGIILLVIPLRSIFYFLSSVFSTTDDHFSQVIAKKRP